MEKANSNTCSPRPLPSPPPVGGIKGMIRELIREEIRDALRGEINSVIADVIKPFDPQIADAESDAIRFAASKPVQHALQRLAQVLVSHITAGCRQCSHRW